jgi:hypothetical protein
VVVSDEVFQRLEGGDMSLKERAGLLLLAFPMSMCCVSFHGDGRLSYHSAGLFNVSLKQ